MRSLLHDISDQNYIYTPQYHPTTPLLTNMPIPLVFELGTILLFQLHRYAICTEEPQHSQQLPVHNPQSYHILGVSKDFVSVFTLPLWSSYCGTDGFTASL